MTADLPSDDVLMRHLREHDESALLALYDRYSAQVFAVAQRILRSSQDAEEVTLDVFTEMWEKPERFNPKRSSARTYILRVAHSRSIDRLRWNAARRIQIDQVEVEKLPLEGDEPASNSIRTERDDTIAAEIRRLSPREQKILQMAYFDHMTQREISEALRIPLGTVKTSVRQAIAHLKQSLRPWRERGQL